MHWQRHNNVQLSQERSERAPLALGTPLHADLPGIPRRSEPAPLRQPLQRMAFRGRNGGRAEKIPAEHHAEDPRVRVSLRTG